MQNRELTKDEIARSITELTLQIDIKKREIQHLKDIRSRWTEIYCNISPPPLIKMPEPTLQDVLDLKLWQPAQISLATASNTISD